MAPLAAVEAVELWLGRLTGLPQADLRSQSRTSVTWTVSVLVGLGLTALAVAAHLRVGSPAAPFTGTLRTKVKLGSPLAPGVAVAVVLAVRAGVHQRLRWRSLLGVSYLAALAWSVALAVVDGGNGLARPITNPTEYLRDVPAVGGDPIGFVRGFVARAAAYGPATRGHPPAPVLLLWALGRAGLHSPAALGFGITAIGCLTVPCVAVAVASLSGQPAARRLLPALVLAPWAVWVAVSMDAVTGSLAAGAIAFGCLATTPRSGRSPLWAAAAGLLLGTAALFSYAVAWLGVTLLVVYFVRRRVAPLVITAVGTLVPLAVFRLWGFTWPRGLAVARDDFAQRVAGSRNGLLWAALDVLLLLIACGPVLLSAARRLRDTPSWPFLVGAGAAVLFTLVTGLARGEVERSWLPFFPWLLVPASAAPRAPVLLVALGAVGAVVVEAVLRTTW